MSLFAILVAALSLSSHTATTYDVEVFILLVIFFGGSLSTSSFRFRRHFTEGGLGVRRWMFITVSIFAVWFWFHGRDHFQDSPCGSRVFIFANVPLNGRVRVFFKVLAVLNLLARAQTPSVLSLDLAVTYWIVSLFLLACAKTMYRLLWDRKRWRGTFDDVVAHDLTGRITDQLHEPAESRLVSWLRRYHLDANTGYFINSLLGKSTTDRTY